jgi:hypothetical protein
MAQAGNTKGGKYNCTVDLLFDWFGISCMTTEYFFYLQNRPIQTSQTGGQWYSDGPPLLFPGSGHGVREMWLIVTNAPAYYTTVLFTDKKGLSKTAKNFIAGEKHKVSML